MQWGSPMPESSKTPVSVEGMPERGHRNLQPAHLKLNEDAMIKILVETLTGLLVHHG